MPTVPATPPMIAYPLQNYLLQNYPTTMPYSFSEDGLVKSALQECLEELGWTVLTAWKKETFVSATAYGEGARTLVQGSSVKEPGRVNQEKYRLLKDGVPVSYTGTHTARHFGSPSPAKRPERAGERASL